MLTTIQESIEKGQINAEIAFVFNNREPGEAEETDRFLQLVRSYHIPLICLSSRRFKTQKAGGAWPRYRLEYDREVMSRLEGFDPDLCVLAGYMLIVGEEMCQRYNMINLHPAAPGGPTGTWQEVIWKLIETKASETGVMMHLVTPELDKGPPVSYCTFSIRGEPFDRYWSEIKGRSIEEARAQEGEKNPLFRLIREHGLAREFPLIVTTIKAFSEGKVRVDRRTAAGRASRPPGGYDLTKEIDEKVKGAIL